MLDVKDLSVSYGSFKALSGLDFSVEKGQWLMIAGPNGAGKSTALAAISQSAEYTGTVTVNGDDLKHIKPRQRAKMIGILSQNHYVGYSFSVREVVELGLYSLSDKEKRTSADDRIEEALAMTGLKEKEAQSVLILSGGELQRTFLAQILAQDPEIMLLDEPANHLDLIYQKQVFELVSKWLSQGDRAVVSVVHDLSLAKKYGTHAILLDHGRAVCSGECSSVLTRENLEKVYKMDVYGWMDELHSVWEE